jgi:hypothetical protein
MNPPTITVAPLGILATASSTETAFIGDSEISCACGRANEGGAGPALGFDLNQSVSFRIRRDCKDHRLSVIAARQRRTAYRPTTCAPACSAAFNDAWRRSGIRTWCCGTKKRWLDRSADLKTMSAVLPDCLLIKVPGIGHSMNPKSTALYAGWCSAGWPEVK